MKKIITLSFALLATFYSAEAQRQFKKCTSDKIYPPIHRPHFSKRPDSRAITVSFDASSTVLTVKFPSNSQSSTAEVFREGMKVTGVTANGGTTFSCKLRDYGTGNYNVIVSSGNTVIDSRNYTVK